MSHTIVAVSAGYDLFALDATDPQPQKLVSQSGTAELVMQSDGNLVVYDEKGAARWSSKTAASETTDQGFSCSFQVDGNLVVYDAEGKALWASHTQGHPNALLMVQNDGNVVIYDPYPKALWASNTAH